MQIVSPVEQIDFERNKQLLNRYRFIEYESVRILAGWLPATAQMDFKLGMGRYLWEDAHHVQQLYQRLREVQTPAFRPPGDDYLEKLMAEAIHAPNELGLIAGLFRVIKPALVEAYRWHIGQTFANPDAPTLYAFKHILIDKEEQIAWATDLLRDHPVGAWETYMADLLASAGGVTGHDSRQPMPKRPSTFTPFTPPTTCARDERFNAANRRAGQKLPEVEIDAKRTLEFESYSQEMLAAETVALIIYLSPDMPWEFVYDSARHCYDEVRHCKLGIEWLAKHGLDFMDVPQNTRIYDWRSQYDPATQYCLLTMGNETHAFPHRHESIAAYREIGDDLSIQYINYDMADERQHVAYGHKWLPKLLDNHGIDKDVDDFIKETVALWEAEYRTGTLPIHEKE